MASGSYSLRSTPGASIALAVKSRESRRKKRFFGEEEEASVSAASADAVSAVSAKPVSKASTGGRSKRQIVGDLGRQERILARLGRTYTDTIIFESPADQREFREYWDGPRGYVVRKDDNDDRSLLYWGRKFVQLHPRDKQYWFNKVEVRKISDVKGYGVIAREAIPKGKIIAIYSGVLRKAKREETSRYFFNFLNKSTILGRDWVIDAEKFGNFASLFNHDEDANLTAYPLNLPDLPYILIVTDRAIAPGEELCLNYGRSYWEALRERGEEGPAASGGGSVDASDPVADDMES